MASSTLRLYLLHFSCSAKVSAMSSSTLKRWLRPEVYPLFAAMGVALGICGMQLFRNISGNHEVRVTKEKRVAGIFINFISVITNTTTLINITDSVLNVKKLMDPVNQTEFVCDNL
ncbi:hypothetical protein L2E82_29679 [Cichorium intybus]|uniref:Uncharacterized protein n=1 Tax=Cichorium intybus TaxID=13427 RepID=A0ACB9CYN9_CICIN|nr:hypothetical protein L2E82_29679 [Cichorium intybus]